MTLASVGTVVTLFTGKKLHAGFGMAWTLLSLWHGWQHSTKMRNDVKKIVGMDFCGKNNTKEPHLADFLASIRIVSFTEGRLRCRSFWFVENGPLKKQIEEYACSFTGVKSAEANTLTGSLLIEYDPEKLRTKPNLAALEQYCIGLTKIR